VTHRLVIAYWGGAWDLVAAQLTDRPLLHFVRFIGPGVVVGQRCQIEPVVESREDRKFEPRTRATSRADSSIQQAADPREAARILLGSLKTPPPADLT
jgi:hypothetical protein